MPLAPLDQADTDLVTQALHEFVRYHVELANNMNELYVAGGNGLVTKQGAKTLADTHLMLSLQAENLLDRMENADRLAFVDEG